MKIQIWTKKEDAISGNITKYYLNQPFHLGYVQVEITRDEFAKLEDRTTVKSANELEQRIYKESQSTTGGDFSNWHGDLNAEEKEAYNRIYGH